MLLLLHSFSLGCYFVAIQSINWESNPAKTLQMKNKKIKAFKTKLSEIVTEQIERERRATSNHLLSFDDIKFNVFTNEHPFEGEEKNTIFFTYCDHYRGNSGTWMSVGQLGQSHQNMDDRGYIKGVATDLDGYVKLCSASCLNHNLHAPF